MSRTTQEKFFEALEVLADTYKLEVVNDPQYANTGSIRFERPTAFTSVLSFQYSFQQGYASFEACKPPFGMPHLDGRSFPYVTPSEIQSVLDTIQEVLKKA